MKRRDFLKTSMATLGVGAAALASSQGLMAHDTTHDEEKPLAKNLKELTELGLVFGKIGKIEKNNGFEVNSIRPDPVMPVVSVKINGKTDWPQWPFRKLKTDASDLLKDELVVIEGQMKGKDFHADRVLFPYLVFEGQVSNHSGNVLQTTSDTLNLSEISRPVNGEGRDGGHIVAKPIDQIKALDKVEGLMVLDPSTGKKHVLMVGVKGP